MCIRDRHETAPENSGSLENTEYNSTEPGMDETIVMPAVSDVGLSNGCLLYTSIDEAVQKAKEMQEKGE